MNTVTYTKRKGLYDIKKTLSTHSLIIDLNNHTKNITIEKRGLLIDSKSEGLTVLNKTKTKHRKPSGFINRLSREQFHFQ